MGLLAHIHKHAYRKVLFLFEKRVSGSWVCLCEKRRKGFSLLHFEVRHSSLRSVQLLTTRRCHKNFKYGEVNSLMRLIISVIG